MQPPSARPIRYAPRQSRSNLRDRTGYIAAVCILVCAALWVAAVQVYGPAVARWLGR